MASKKHDELAHLLRGMFLATMAESFTELAVRAEREGLSHEEFLYELARLERETRDHKKVERLLVASHLPREKTFETLDLDAFPIPLRRQIETLRSGAFLRGAKNVIAIGEPGTGKSHVTSAIGHELVQSKRSVLWMPTYAMVQRLLAAKRDLRLPRELAKLDRVECLILDDIGYVQQEREEMEVLFTLLAARYERSSTVISTNLAFEDWDQIFKNPMTTAAAIDRVVHHSVILDLAGVESYRVKEAEGSAPRKEETAVVPAIP